MRLCGLDGPRGACRTRLGCQEKPGFKHLGVTALRGTLPDTPARGLISAFSERHKSKISFATASFDCRSAARSRYNWRDGWSGRHLRSHSLPAGRVSQELFGMNRVLVCLHRGRLCVSRRGRGRVGRARSCRPSCRQRSPAPSAATDLTALSDRFEAVARRLSPAVVSIEAVKPSGTKPDGKPRTRRGFRVRRADRRRRRPWAIVITNNHVITGADGRPRSASTCPTAGCFKPTQVARRSGNRRRLASRGRHRPAAGPAGRQRPGSRRPVGAGGRQPVRAEPVGHARHHLRPRARQRQPRQHDPHQGLSADRRGDQPRLDRRPAGQPRRRGDRHQHGHRVAVGGQQRRGVLHPDQPGPARGPAA